MSVAVGHPAVFPASFPRRRESSGFALHGRSSLWKSSPRSTSSPAIGIGTLYIGVTSDLVARAWQHREHAVDGFTPKYEVIRLVWYELHGDMHSAITREKQIKKWNRAWKIRLIEEGNVSWRDLWPEIVG